MHSLAFQHRQLAGPKLEGGWMIGKAVHCVALAFALACAAGLANAQATGIYSIRGRVVDASTGRPLAELRMFLANPADWQQIIPPVTSGPDGRFAFSGLSAGRYLLQTLYGGEAIVYGELSDSEAVTVEAGPTEENKEVVFHVAAHPGLSGIVLDEMGEPAAGVLVSVFVSRWRNGKVVFDQARPGQTNDLGEFQISALSPGNYYLCATASDQMRPLTAPNPANASSFDFAARPEPRAYKRACFPSEPLSSIPLDWGQDRRVTLQLEPVSVIHVRGRVVNNTAGGVSLGLSREGGGSSIPGFVQPGGAFDVGVTEPGTYIIWAGPGASGPASDGAVARKRVAVGASGVSGIELERQASSSMEVYFERPPSPPLQRDSAFLGLRDVDEMTGELGVLAAVGGQDGPARLPTVHAGRYWVVTRTASPFCVESVRHQGRELLHGTLTVPPDSALRLDVKLSTTCGGIDGHVVDKGKPAALAQVVLLLSGSAQSPGDLISVTADAEGAFSFSLLPPGRYWLWAWQHDDPHYPGPESLAEVAGMACEVVVGSGSRSTTRVPLISRGGGKR